MKGKKEAEKITEVRGEKNLRKGRYKQGREGRKQEREKRRFKGKEGINKEKEKVNKRKGNFDVLRECKLLKMHRSK